MKNMKYIKEWHNFSIDENIDYELDKISKGGELTPNEKEKMVAYSSHLSQGKHPLDFEWDKQNTKVIKDPDGIFTFTLESIEYPGDETYYNGVIECPDYTDDSGKIIPGIIPGRIVTTKDAVYSDFYLEEEDLTVYDFCERSYKPDKNDDDEEDDDDEEYEESLYEAFESFLDYVVHILENEKESQN